MIVFDYEDSKALLITSIDLNLLNSLRFSDVSQFMLKRLDCLRIEGINHIFVLSSIPKMYMPIVIRRLIQKELGRDKKQVLYYGHVGGS